jgi:hypothetical protein
MPATTQPAQPKGVEQVVDANLCQGFDLRRVEGRPVGNIIQHAMSTERSHHTSRGPRYTPIASGRSDPEASEGGDSPGLRCQAGVSACYCAHPLLGAQSLLFTKARRRETLSSSGGALGTERFPYPLGESLENPLKKQWRARQDSNLRPSDS